MSFTDFYKKDMLGEGTVPFSKYDLIKQKMSEHYAVPDGTFGIEFEYLPRSKDEYSLEDIVEALSKNYNNSTRLRLDYESWIEDKRSDAQRDFIRSKSRDISDYDTTYGAMSPDFFEDVFPEPQEKDYNTKEEYEAALNVYEGAAREVAYEYRTWQRRDFEDYLEEFLTDIANNGEWDNYIDASDVETNIEAVIQDDLAFLSSYVTIKRDNKHDKDFWTIGDDGPNIEIRSPILKKEQMGQVEYVTTFIETQETTGGCGLHIHIGVPKTFTAFDLLAMTTLVDEKQVEQELNAVDVRRDTGFAKFRAQLATNLIATLTHSMGKMGTPEPLTFNNAELLYEYSKLDRYLGTNIKAFTKYRTVEFRYFGAKNTKNLTQWIEYFLLLPHIAQKRNKIVLHSYSNGTKLYAVRMPSLKTKIELVKFGEQPTIKALPYPASQITLSQEPPSLKHKYK